MSQFLLPMRKIATIFAVFALLCLCLVPTQAQQPSSSQGNTPRKPLPKPPKGNRGFDQYAGPDASARLIAAGGTRGDSSPGAAEYANGLTEYKAGRYTQAAAYFVQAAEAQKTRPDYRYALALSYMEIEKQSEAESLFKEVIHLSSDKELSLLSYYNLGVIYTQRGQYHEAVDAYSAAIKLDPELSRPHYNLGVAYAALGQTKEAAEQFKNAISLKPAYAEAHYNLAVAYFQLGSKSQASEQLNVLSSLSPTLADRLKLLLNK
jgi:tetratricopeptide (TPR) repeat protein